MFLLQGDTERDRGLARVLDLDQGRLFQPYNVDSILARGYWDEPEGDEDAAKLLEGVERVDGRVRDLTHEIQ